ncbi:MarR family transcriptional regulator [Novosphingobium sp. BL-8H]|uniref:MarR family transcriptional regulator n=1 Tax=Novosphingobium sp. BL-8H TaxID=3127640 RepID=UPI003757442D
MDDMDFSYGADCAAAGWGGNGMVRQGPSPLLTIFADRPHVRAAMREDAVAAGMRVTIGSLAQVLAEPDDRQMRDVMLGDVVLVDCPLTDAETLAALARLDLLVAGSGIRLIVSTSSAALEDVFACMDCSDSLLLVDPTPAERLVALGRVLAGLPQGRVRELSEDDRLMILRLTEQVGQIAGRIERLAPSSAGEVEPRERSVEPVVSAARPASANLPEPRLVRKILRQRQLRARYIEGDLFADPAWDMLLDLAAAREEGKQVSVTSLCIAAAVPPTTALRWIGQMVTGGLFRRVCDDNDRRRAFIELTDKAVDALGRYFDEIDLALPAPV